MSGTALANRSPTPADPFRHEAFLYSGSEHFLAGAAAFVRGALAAGEAVLVAIVESRAALLRRVLGTDADRVGFLDMERVGRNPARIIPAWQDWVEENAATARGFRGISESVWAGRTPSELAECRQHERLLNTAFDRGPGWWLLCPYDIDALPASAVDAANGSHPCVVDHDIHTRGAGYPDAGFAHPALSDEPLDEPSVPMWELDFGLPDLGRLRDEVTDFAKKLEGDRRADDAALVVSELAANSIKYGGGAGVLRLWHEGADLVCEVRDRGLITDALAGQRRPTGLGGQAGLWISNRVCDLLQIRSAPGKGTVVRARFAGSGQA
ncbi:anti-sigma regulatory factor (Ser/Thr protein kinase) [Catenulispora sp. GP43]|uniref:anti-sigma factor RsbA family regulatory protein n=1 Tax=Catenulispora sp. GP43 TaxID=3156263 RepID=UPI003519CA4B